MSEAGHLQVGPAKALGKGSAIQEVLLAFGQPQRPRLGDAQVHERQGAQVAAERDVRVGLANGRGGERMHLLKQAAEIPAQPL